eukprot:375346_1
MLAASLRFLCDYHIYQDMDNIRGPPVRDYRYYNLPDACNTISMVRCRQIRMFIDDVDTGHIKILRVLKHIFSLYINNENIASGNKMCMNIIILYCLMSLSQIMQYLKIRNEYFNEISEQSINDIMTECIQFILNVIVSNENYMNTLCDGWDTVVLESQGIENRYKRFILKSLLLMPNTKIVNKTLFYLYCKSAKWNETCLYWRKKPSNSSYIFRSSVEDESILNLSVVMNILLYSTDSYKTQYCNKQCENLCNDLLECIIHTNEYDICMGEKMNENKQLILIYLLRAFECIDIYAKQYLDEYAMNKFKIKLLRINRKQKIDKRILSKTREILRKHFGVDTDKMMCVDKYKEIDEYRIEEQIGDDQYVDVYGPTYKRRQFGPYAPLPSPYFPRIT